MMDGLDRNRERVPQDWRAGWAKVRGFLRSYPGGALLLLLLTCGLFGAFWSGDVRFADTASYFSYAAVWAKKGKWHAPLVMGFSPLYLIFFAWVQRVFSDAVIATAVHHFLITCGTVLATLAAVRRLLPAGWAWVVTAWWVALHWNSWFEVHQFGFALLMLGAALAGQGRSAWWRGAALAVLLATAALVRNEFLPAAGLFGLACLLAPPEGPRWRQLLALSVPSVVAGLLVVALFWGDLGQLKLGNFRLSFDQRNRVNLQQVYPFGYRQRHTDWLGDPWLGGGELMQRDFGRRDPTMREAIAANPRAMAEHILWNFRLLPAGLQLGLFGGYTGASSPEYALERFPSTRDPWVISLAFAALWIAGAVLLIRWRRRYGHFFLSGAPAFWVWTFLACLLPSCLVAIATQRPRPSYIFPLLLVAMVFSVLAFRLVLKAVQQRWILPATYPRWIPVGLAAAMLVALPKAPLKRNPPHRLADDYHRLAGLTDAMAREARVLCVNSERGTDLVNYLSDGRKPKWKSVAWSSLGPVADAETLRQALETHGVTDFYLADNGVGYDRFGSALGGDWQEIAAVNDAGGRWQYWARPPHPAAVTR